MKALIPVCALLGGCSTLQIGPDIGHVSSLTQHIACGVSNKCWGFDEIGVAVRARTGPVEWQVSDHWVPEVIDGEHFEIFEAHATLWFPAKQ